jgi:hypothetical protein
MLLKQIKCVIQRILQPDILDIGASVGDFWLFVKKQVGKLQE